MGTDCCQRKRIPGETRGVGNLLDFGNDDGGASSGNTNSGWDNEVWADDEEWQTLDLDSGSGSKGKKSS